MKGSDRHQNKSKYQNNPNNPDNPDNPNNLKISNKPFMRR